MAVDSSPIQVASLIERGLLTVNDGYRAKNSELADHGLPFARGGNIAGGFDFDDADRFPEQSLGKVGEKVSRPGDVVFTSKGTVGRFAFVTEDTPRFVYSPQLCFWRSLNHDVIYPRWLFYWMQGGEFFNQYSGVKGQTDMADYVSLGDQRRMLVTVPPIEEQRRIAEVLGALDEKINLNHTTNRAAEAIARAFFKSWFIDFEPVKTKIAGATRFRGMPQDVFDQLPHQYIDSDLGPIPDGWGYVPIGDLVEVVGGATPSTTAPEFWEGGELAFCTPKDMSRLDSPVLLDTERKITQAGVDQISSGQLPVGTVLLSSRAPIGYLAIAETPVSVNQGIIAMISPEIPSTYLFFWTASNMDAIEARAGGSTFAEINKQNFRPIPALRPDPRTLAAFGEITVPLFDLILTNERESVALTALRDALLPRLISGVRRLRDSEGEADGR